MTIKTDTIVLINGKLLKDHQPYRPDLVDTRGGEALKHAEKALKLPLRQGKQMTGQSWKMTLAFTCPYCGRDHYEEGNDKIMTTARFKALESLFPVTCNCGARYEKHETGWNAHQTNQ